MAKILITDHIHPDGIKLLEQLDGVEAVDAKFGLPREKLIQEIREYDVLIVRSATKVTKEVIDAGDKLKIVARAGVGLDNIDVNAANARGIKVLNAPEAPSAAVAELVLGMMLSWARKIPEAHASMKMGKWEKSKFMGIELRGKTLGIVGTGQIGRMVGHRARAFGMSLLLYDVVQNVEFANQTGAKYVDLDTLLRSSDFVTMHVPLTPQTKGMIGRREFGLMKPSAVLINTSRGEVVDEDALVEALQQGRIAGACLDVYRKEPLPSDSPLLKLDNVVLTPHIGASTEEAKREAAIIIAEKIKRELANL